MDDDSKKKILRRRFVIVRGRSVSGRDRHSVESQGLYEAWVDVFEVLAGRELEHHIVNGSVAASSYKEMRVVTAMAARNVIVLAMVAGRVVEGGGV